MSPSPQTAPKSVTARTRPAVSVCIPFTGDRTTARSLLRALAVIERRDGDEIVVGDCSPGGTLASEARGSDVLVVRVTRERSSSPARNVAVSTARNPWLLFTDADCRPAADVIDRYFDDPPDDDVGALVGAVHPVLGAPTFIVAHAVARGHDEQAMQLPNGHEPCGAMANLLARRAALEAVGGFHEGIRSGGDRDFGRRLQDAGRRPEDRGDAVVLHEQPERIWRLVRRSARRRAGRGRVHARHPASTMRPRALPALARCAAAAIHQLLRLQPRRAAYALLGVVVILAEAAGGWLANTAPTGPRRGGRSPSGPRIAMLVDQFPEVSETFVAAEARALAALGADVRVEAHGRGRTPAQELAEGVDVRYFEDAGRAGMIAATLWLACHARAAIARDLWDRRRWRDEEVVLPLRVLAPTARRLHDEGVQHIHAHFAAGAALSAMRLSALLEVPWSMTAHGYDIFRDRRNLAEKIHRAAFSTTGSDFTVAALRAQADPADARRIHRIVMGVDGDVWRRRTPPADGGVVLAVGRLVPKKGFRHLLEAIAQLGDDEGFERAVIVGGGPLRDELEAQARALGITGRVTFLGPRPASAVRDLLEGAAVVAIPCVIAPDGDADSMPVIAKEAMAMEVPVVASDAAGLPEVVDATVGRLVRAGDAAALARGLREVLALDPAARAALGRAGRARATGPLGLRTQTQALLDLMGGCR